MAGLESGQELSIFLSGDVGLLSWRGRAAGGCRPRRTGTRLFSAQRAHLDGTCELFVGEKERHLGAACGY